MNDFMQEFIGQAIHRIDENTPRIANCLGKLEDGEVWKRPNGSSNSVGNLILHLCGNITQYAVSSLGNVPDHRDRDQEFLVEGGWSKEELLDKLTDTVQLAKKTIQAASLDELMRKRSVQGFTYSGIGIIIHITEHYAYHTGQIAFWTKILKNSPLGFYDGIDLNQKNN